MTDNLTPDDLANIEARAEAATEGPWEVRIAPDFNYDVRVPYVDDDPTSTAYIEDDAEFIAHARTDVPRLVRALREAWAAEKRVRKARLCKKHYWSVDDEVYSQDGCTLCYMNRAEAAETERDRLRAQVEAVRALADRPGTSAVYVGDRLVSQIPAVQSGDIRAALDAS
jgi:hypothetical protein